MKSIGFIPLRKGSKGIPGKNKKKLLGRPLFCWVLGEAIASTLDAIYVYTDDDDIISFCEREYHWTDKVQTVKRSEERYRYCLHRNGNAGVCRGLEHHLIFYAYFKRLRHLQPQ